MKRDFEMVGEGFPGEEGLWHEPLLSPFFRAKVTGRKYVKTVNSIDVSLGQVDPHGAPLRSQTTCRFGFGASDELIGRFITLSPNLRGWTVSQGKRASGRGHTPRHGEGGGNDTHLSSLNLSIRLLSDLSISLFDSLRFFVGVPNVTLPSEEHIKCARLSLSLVWGLCRGLASLPLPKWFHRRTSGLAVFYLAFAFSLSLFVCSS